MVALSTAHLNGGRFAFPLEAELKPKDLSRYINFDEDVDPEYYLPKDNRYYHMISGAAKGERQIYQLRKYLVRTKEPGVARLLRRTWAWEGTMYPSSLHRAACGSSPNMSA